MDRERKMSKPESPRPTVTHSKPREPRRPYVPPRLSKKRSVARVTLFSGGGVTAGGLTASG